MRPGGRWETDGRPEQLLRRAIDRCGRSEWIASISISCMPPIPGCRWRRASARWRICSGRARSGGSGCPTCRSTRSSGRGASSPILTVQNRLNPFFREAISSGVVAHCARHGIGFLAYSPTGGGRLNLKLPDHPSWPRWPRAWALGARHRAGVGAEQVADGDPDPERPASGARARQRARGGPARPGGDR